MSILQSYLNIDPRELRLKVEKHLQWAYAHGHLSIEELEKRLETLNRSEEKSVLLTLVEDLPSSEEETGATGDESLRPPRDSFFTFLGSNTRKGPWDVPPRLDVTAVLGSQILDFRQARFAKGTTIINACAILGSVDIKFSPGVCVSSKGIPILGSIENRVQSDIKGPQILIEGIVFMGSISAKTKK